MRGTSAPIPSSEKTSLYLAAAKNHLGLIITFVLTLFIPVGGILIGILGEELLLVPILGGLLFFLIPYFIFSSLKSSISHYYETALINQFGLRANAIVSHKSIEKSAYGPHNDQADDEPIEDVIYYIDYKYTYGKPYTSSFIIDNKALYNSIEVGSEITIKLLASSPEKSTPIRKELARAYGFDVSECQ